jgi:hypothetical protein
MASVQPETQDLQSILTENFFYFFLRLRKGHVRKVVEAMNARYPEQNPGTAG